MPTRPTKGDHGHADRGSKGRGGQKATYGSAVDAGVAEGRQDLEHEHEERETPASPVRGDGPSR